MSVAPAGTTSMLVAVTGVVQDPSTYSVVGTTLTFSAAPPTGTNNISVRYLGIPASGVTTTAYRTITNFTATAGQTTFSVPSYAVGYIDVYRNGVRLAAADYTASNGTTVVLTNAASLNDSIVTESFYVSSVLNAIPATAGAVNSTYIANGAVGTAQLADANVTQAKFGTNVAGNGPAFSAYKSSGAGVQNISSGVYNLVSFDVEEYDTASSYNNTGSTVGSTPAWAFKPSVAGYYLISCSCDLVGNTGTLVATTLGLFKNGGNFKATAPVNAGYTGSESVMSISAVIYLDGVSDYIQIYVYGSATSPRVAAGQPWTFFQASLLKAA
jgi:hypothetical protein